MCLPFRKWIASGVLSEGSQNACQEWEHPVLAGRWIQFSLNKIARQLPPKITTWQEPSGYAAVVGGAGTVLEVTLLRSCMSWLLHVVSIENIIQPHWNNRRKDFVWLYRGSAIWIVHGSEIKTLIYNPSCLSVSLIRDKDSVASSTATQYKYFLPQYVLELVYVGSTAWVFREWNGCEQSPILLIGSTSDL